MERRMDATTTRGVTIDEAARILGLSRRTVERRLTRGTLTGRKQGARWVVDVVIDPTTLEREERNHDRRAIDGLTNQVADLSRQVGDLTRERDTLTRRIDELLADRERWQQQAGMNAANVQAALEIRGLLAERVESTTSTTAKRWWRLWAR